MQNLLIKLWKDWSFAILLILLTITSNVCVGDDFQIKLTDFDRATHVDMSVVKKFGDSFMFTFETKEMIVIGSNLAYCCLSCPPLTVVLDNSR